MDKRDVGGQDYGTKSKERKTDSGLFGVGGLRGSWEGIGAVAHAKRT